MHVIDIDLKQAHPHDKIEMMEKTQKVMSSDFLKRSRHLEKVKDELNHVKDTLDCMKKEEKAKNVKITHL